MVLQAILRMHVVILSYVALEPGCRVYFMTRHEQTTVLFPELLVLLYARVASLFYIERVGPDRF
jgi:hypothetical protein